jgi:aryl-phospho-beta-D-glucosidase BglC (GH1 family)
VLEEDSNPGVFLEQGFSYLDNSVRWAAKNGLNVVIDVHRVLLLTGPRQAGLTRHP